ncbi:MAG TPA: GDP-L-fucose synthase [Myxococcota bacterium]|nr:GDP-L-fucose synthase [Myxococcota bacterium]
MTFALSDKKILVTGAHGFLGSFVTEALLARGATELLTPRHAELDLLDRDQIHAYLDEHRPDAIVHLAAVVGGIGANRRHPGRFFYENLVMGVELIEGARRFGVNKVATVGTICAYPKFTPVPFREDALWDGYPEETNAPYGIAKKALLVMGQAYRQEYGLDAIYLLPVNLYGPRDDFDPSTSHVIPALIRKMVEARDQGLPEVEVWGDGSPSREFLHARDAARGIALALERYDSPEPVNLGTGTEITIKALAELIARLTGYRGTLRWNPDQPNGQPRRCLDTSRAREAFGFTAETSFEDGLAETIAWWEQHKP